MFGRMLFLWLYKVSEAAWQPPQSPTEETPERYAVLSTYFIFISLILQQGGNIMLGGIVFQLGVFLFQTSSRTHSMLTGSQ